MKANVGALTSVMGSTKGAAMPAEELYLRLCEHYEFVEGRAYYKRCACGSIGGGVHNGLISSIFIAGVLYYFRM